MRKKWKYCCITIFDPDKYKKKEKRLKINSFNLFSSFKLLHYQWRNYSELKLG